MSKDELLQRLHALTTDFHTMACDMDIGDERTEVFEMYEVLRRIQRRAQLVKCWLQLTLCFALAFMMMGSGWILLMKMMTDF